MKAEDYTHRIGRTGRAGRDGLAVTLAEFRDRRKIFDIEAYTRQHFQGRSDPGPGAAAAVQVQHQQRHHRHHQRPAEANTAIGSSIAQDGMGGERQVGQPR
jgi:superfamily II DNA/RNA helicase